MQVTRFQVAIPLFHRAVPSTVNCTFSHCSRRHAKTKKRPICWYVRDLTSSWGA